MNINTAIIQGAKVLKDSFIKNPYLDSEILMTKVIGKDRKYILLNSEIYLNAPMKQERKQNPIFG